MIPLMDRLLALDIDEDQALPLNLAETLGRDIENLLNHPAECRRQLGDPLLASSVVNYGLPLPVGTRIDGGCMHDIAQQIALALERFEPRLDCQTIEVRPQALERPQPGVFGIDIKAGLKNASHKHFGLRLSFDMHFGMSTLDAHVLDMPKSAKAH